MANFKKVISNKYGTKTYQDTKNTYDWINKSIDKGGFCDLTIKSDFLFHISDITCSCEGIEEFVENAYGQADYDLVSFNMSVRSAKESIAYITINSFGGISVSTESRVMLERVVNLLEQTSLDETEVNDPISVTYIETQINNDGVIIQGDGNVVANDHSEVESAQKEAGAKAFWAGILQNVTSNFIWYLLTFGAGLLLSYLATNR